MASAIDHEKHRDSSSLDGKVDGHGIHSEVINPLSDLPDPDAGLSEEERAAAVRAKLHTRSGAELMLDRTRSWSASSTLSLSHGCLSFISSVGYDRMVRSGLHLTRIPAFLDRTNIGNAKVDGLQDDLKMTNGQYNATLTIFFVSYAVFEPLTNVLLKKMRPSIFLPLIMVCHTEIIKCAKLTFQLAWGIVMVCMGLVHNYSGMMACRFFLGLAEAGLFPGVNYVGLIPL